MSLLGANTTFKKAVARMRAEERKSAEKDDHSTESVSSGIGAQIRIALGLEDLDGTATTSEIVQKKFEDAMGGPVVLPRDVYNERARMHNQEAREIGHASQMVSTVYGGSSVDEEGNLVYKQPRVYTILDSSNRGRQRSRSLDSQGSSRLSSPLPMTSYGGSSISFPVNTQSTKYTEGTIVGFPLSAIPQDPFSTPRVTAGIIAQRYIQSEEDASQNVTDEEEEEGMEETLKVYTSILRKFEVSDNSDDAMTEVDLRDEEPYMTPTKKEKSAIRGRGLKGRLHPNDQSRICRRRQAGKGWRLIGSSLQRV
jgi:hypothetical protein